MICDLVYGNPCSFAFAVHQSFILVVRGAIPNGIKHIEEIVGDAIQLSQLLMTTSSKV